MNPVKQQILREEVQYLLDNDFIEPSQSEWSFPCILVPKPDGTFSMCTDYRKVNSVTKTDTFPIPRIDDCIDNIGQAKYVTKFDLLKANTSDKQSKGDLSICYSRRIVSLQSYAVWNEELSSDISTLS